MLNPTTEAELSEAISTASQPMTICGGGTRSLNANGGLTTLGLSGISLYEPGALTLVAQAGTPVADIDAALTAEGQRLAFEPMDHRGLLGTSGTPTIGGVVAANVSGPRRVQVGACRDFLLGTRFVDGMGRILKNGGRVMKNVTGYDLARLMAGSWGRLGIMTEVSLKVLPAPEAQACLMIDGLKDQEAATAMSAALGSPYDVTGAAHIPVGMSGDPVTMLRIEGFAGSVAYRLNQLETMFAGKPTRREEDSARVATGWAWVRDVEALHGLAGDVWRISCKPSDGPSLAAKLNAQKLIYDWGGGLIWALMPEGDDARTRLGTFDGHATLIRGDTSHRPKFQPQTPGIARLEHGIRRKFDPKGLFNPGLGK